MYISNIRITNFKGIKNLEVDLHPSINLIIGENGSHKTAFIDAIRVLYNIGKEQKDFFLTKEDIYNGETEIELEYHFKGLTDNQKGSFYECLVLGKDGEEDYARFVLKYKKEEKKEYLSSTYATGQMDGQRPDSNVFRQLRHYYLSALRDCTRDLLSTKGNILGGLIYRLVEKNKSEEKLIELIDQYNKGLSDLPETETSRDSINKNLDIIHSEGGNKIGVFVEHSDPENIVKIIKPFLPFDKETLKGAGFSIRQNSLGFNNLIYISTVLGDLERQLEDDPISHFALLIEEPEAHLHPQLQLGLYSFFAKSNLRENSQLFITSHSPTLTSKVPLDNIIYLSANPERAVPISNCFIDPKEEMVGYPVVEAARHETSVMSYPESTETHDSITTTSVAEEEEDDDEIVDDEEVSELSARISRLHLKKLLERYIDVTRSQLFYSKGVLFVEGISEAMLLPALASLEGISLEEKKIEIINVAGTSFGPFIPLFNSKAIGIPAVILTDDDVFMKSKKVEFGIRSLLKTPAKLLELVTGIQTGTKTTRLVTLDEGIAEYGSLVKPFVAQKTFEYELIKANVFVNKATTIASPMFSFLKTVISPKILVKLESYIAGLPEEFSEVERQGLVALLWKAIPKNFKAELAHNLALYINENHATLKDTLLVPPYIKDALAFLTKK